MKTTLLFVFFLLLTYNSYSQVLWTPQVSGTNEQLYTVYFVNANTGVVGGWNKILKTTNGGVNWVTENIVQGIAVMSFPLSLEGWATGFGGTVKKTTDGGQTWNSQSNFTPNDLNGLFFLNQQTGFTVGGYGNYYRTTNSGINWQTLSSGTSRFLYGIKFADAQTGWIVGDSIIRKSTNGGNDWFTQNPASLTNFSNLTVLNTQTVLVSGGNGSIIKTTNSGSTWLATSTGISKPIFEMFFINSNRGWAVGDSGHALYTLDAGNTWGLTPTNNSNPLISVYFVNENIGWAVGFGGTILKTTNGGVTSIGSQNSTAIGYFLSQNYPNPFNPTTDISYSIGVAGNVNITVYDLLGRQVAELVNGYKEAGNYSVRFDAMDLSSGIYYYRLKSGSYTSIKKMLLIK